MTKQSEGAVPSEPMFDALSIYAAFEYFLEASDRLYQLEKHYGTLPRVNSFVLNSPSSTLPYRLWVSYTSNLNWTFIAPCFVAGLPIW